MGTPRRVPVSVSPAVPQQQLHQCDLMPESRSRRILPGLLGSYQCHWPDSRILPGAGKCPEDIQDPIFLLTLECKSPSAIVSSSLGANFISKMMLVRLWNVFGEEYWRELRVSMTRFEGSEEGFLQDCESEPWAWPVCGPLVVPCLS